MASSGLVFQDSSDQGGMRGPGSRERAGPVPGRDFSGGLLSRGRLACGTSYNPPALQAIIRRYHPTVMMSAHRDFSIIGEVRHG